MCPVSADTEIVDAEVVEPDGPGTDLEVAPQPQDARLALFGTTEAEGVLTRATSIADTLAPVIENKRLFSMIQGRKHVRVEGWQTLGAMLGVFAVITHTERITDNSGKDGWEARCEVRVLSGAVIGAADAQCTRSESTWKSRDDYALRSMAQTRATSKALRGPLGFIVELAGYSATPAEEMPSQEPASPQPQQGQTGALPAWLTNLIDLYGEERVRDVGEELRAAKNIGAPIKAVGGLRNAPEDFRQELAEELAKRYDVEAGTSTGDGGGPDAARVQPPASSNPCPECGAECIPNDGPARAPKWKCTNSDCKGNANGDGPWVSWQNEPWNPDKPDRDGLKSQAGPANPQGGGPSAPTNTPSENGNDGASVPPGAPSEPTDAEIINLALDRKLITWEDVCKAALLLVPQFPDVKPPGTRRAKKYFDDKAALASAVAYKLGLHDRLIA